MAAYEIVREGEGYRFKISKVAKGSTSGCALTAMIFVSILGGPIWIWVLKLPFLLFPVALVALWVIVIKRARDKDRRGAVYGAPTTELLVTPEGITLPNGTKIAANRITAIEVRNDYNQGAVVSSIPHTTVAVGGAAAAAAQITNVATSFGAVVGTARALMSYYVSVQAGGTQERVAQKLDEIGANGLATDIARALAGHRLD